MNDHAKLSYFIAEKKSILVVSLVGPLVRSNSHVFESCIQEIQKRDARRVILSFRDVPNTVDRTVYGAFARLQRMIRSKPAELRLASLHPDLRKVFDEQGLIRAAEVVNSLAEALQGVATTASNEAPTIVADKSTKGSLAA